MTKLVFTDTLNLLTNFGKEKSKFSKNKLNYLANRINLQSSKEVLMSSEDLKDKITPFLHQTSNALKYLNEITSNSMLIADEVGLGKTISAGLILKELGYRYDCKKILILCPAPLQKQWQEEMEVKFAENFELVESVHHWQQYNKTICSIDRAKMDKHINEIKQIHWDLIILDEAHRLKNNKTIAYQSFQELHAENKLFLTATPIQNSLEELYHIINLLEFGYFGHISEFKKQFFKNKNGRELTNSDELQFLLSKVMVRNTRSSVNLDFVDRKVHTVRVPSTKDEINFQDAVLNFLSIEYDKIKGGGRNVGSTKMQLMYLLRQLSGDRIIFGQGFKRYVEKNVFDMSLKIQADEILDINENLPNISKMEKTLNLIKKIKKQHPEDKIIIFTTYLGIQDSIVELLEKEGLKVELFNGSLSSDEKNQAIKDFEKEGDVLVSSKSGGEGRNLQFASHLINYDLPWNPMEVEQRIGRIHRIGQEKDVNIYNLVLSDSIEELILDRLYEKIDLFNVAIGEMDDILTEVADSSSFENSIADILLSSNKIDAKKKLEEYFANIRKSKTNIENIHKLNHKTLDYLNLRPYEE